MDSEESLGKVAGHDDADGRLGMPVSAAGATTRTGPSAATPGPGAMREAVAIRAGDGAGAG